MLLNEIDPPINEPKKVKPGEEIYDEEFLKISKLITDPNYKHQYIPAIVLLYILSHAGALYGIFLILTFKLKLLTLIWGLVVGFASLFGGVLGAHRCFCHHSFKVNTFGKVMLIILQTMSGQMDIYWWCREHRLHHKFVDTDADPYNSQRGFFFSHVGWLMTYKHPLVKEKGRTIDMSDLSSDKLVMFQRKYYLPMFLLFNLAIPVGVPVYFWNENFWICFYTVYLYRYMHILNGAWSINSIAHLYGDRPYDARISGRMSKATDIFTFGEGWHNYHHVFPTHNDFSEFGFGHGTSSKFVRFLEKLGIIYDLKTGSPNVAYNHKMRHGDGSDVANEINFKSN